MCDICVRMRGLASFLLQCTPRRCNRDGDDGTAHADAHQVGTPFGLAEALLDLYREGLINYVNFTDPDGFTPLLIACARVDLDATQHGACTTVLLLSKANPFVKTPQSQASPMHFAARCAHASVVSKLAKVGREGEWERSRGRIRRQEEGEWKRWEGGREGGREGRKESGGVLVMTTAQVVAAVRLPLAPSVTLAHCCSPGV